jgi:TatD DNase family protein
VIDSHCHLTATDFDDDRDAVIGRALANGISCLVTISDEMSDLPKCFSLAEKHEQIYYTIGVHPHHAKDFDVTRDISLLREDAKHRKCRGIGEIGLDYHYMRSPKDTQQRVFEAQLVLAKELDLPAVVHCRESAEDVWTIVNHVRPKKLVIHCCTEKWQDVERFVKAGYMLSFTGIVTYPKSVDVRETVKQCPLSHMMVETDAPYLAPVPHRGKRCEPAFVLETAKMIAEIQGVSPEELDRVTTRNTVEFFGLRS